ncbi:DUF3095 domain-containing protein [Hydrogenovibrio kuenenii]|uniref:DUF3095 domain-containing protein n=1 Tax=Hydrogenovibrio kuenenii TaxID=63658 RepID=UPI000466AD49|nr:DUF3095 domain-containing protein [Hydrogenovibrio kuenenii]
MPSIDFEASLPLFTHFEQTLNCDAYTELPSDWYVIVTDVVNSTKAIEEGRYRDVNAVGGSTIAAVVNAAKPYRLPYVFGGDGASFCVPPELIDKVKRAMRGCQELASEGLDLTLRVGVVPVSELKQKIRLCRYRSAPNLTQYFFMGGGMDEADALIKEVASYQLPADTPSEADFSGFECRWNQIPSPKQVTFSLLVKSRLPEQKVTLTLYQRLTDKIEELLGDRVEHHPLSTGNLSLSFDSDKLKAETRAKSFHHSLWFRLKTAIRIRLENLVGVYWMQTHKEVDGFDWGNYKSDLIENSDYQKLDDNFKTVLSCDLSSLQALLAWLEEQYQAGILFYGCHQADAAVITCLVEKTGTDHVHFVDAADGGYAMAAKQLKLQIKADQS